MVYYKIKKGGVWMNKKRNEIGRFDILLQLIVIFLVIAVLTFSVRYIPNNQVIKKVIYSGLFLLIIVITYFASKAMDNIKFCMCTSYISCRMFLIWKTPTIIKEEQGVKTLKTTREHKYLYYFTENKIMSIEELTNK